MAGGPYTTIEQTVEKGVESAIAWRGQTGDRCRPRLSGTFVRVIRGQYEAMPRSI